MGSSIETFDNTVVVVDAMPLLYRGHFVFLRNPRMTADGLNTSALVVFGSTLAQILEEHQPSHMAVVFDSRTPTFRHERYPAYKAHRQKIPEDLAAAIPMAIELCRALRIPVLRKDGFEADDLMGTVARKASAVGLSSVLVTPDKDVAQLVNTHTRLYRPGTRKQESELLGPAEVQAHWGLKDPALMVDLLGLAGDSSDNIPGIAGIGEKTAVALLARFGSLEDVLEQADSLTPKQAAKLRAGVDQALLSRELSQIRCDVPLDLEMESLRCKPPDADALRNLVERYELTQLGRRLLPEQALGDGASADPPRHMADVPHEYHCLRTLSELDDLVSRLAASTAWAFDTETSGLDTRTAALLGISFALQPHEAWYVPLPTDPDEAQVWVGRLRPLFANPKIEKIGHNLKFDVSMLHYAGVPVSGPFRDSMLAAYVLDAADRHGLDHLARQRLNYEPVPITDLIGRRGSDQLSLSNLQVDDVADYAAEDADVTLQLHRVLRPEVKAAGALPALVDCEEPLIPVLVAMEAEGVQVDTRALRAYAFELEHELADLEKRVHEAAGVTFNIASPRQLGEVLFDRLKLNDQAGRTKSGQYATGEAVLQKLAGQHPVVDLALEHRACAKLKNTYVDKLPQWVSPRTGRVHTTFSQALTETGRLSSQNPNLQNIPIRTERGRRIRAAFVPRDDAHVLLAADYSQIELRIMAAFSRDAGMIEAFRKGGDIHRETAARVHGVMPECVTDDMRAQAKMVNFGIIYGISAHGLSQRLGVPRKQAASLIEAYFTQYPGVKRYMEETIAAARETGYTRTLLGRRRLLRDITSRNNTSRQAAERTAINTPIQGAAADIIKLAMVRIHEAFETHRLRSRMVLQVHDELLFDTHIDEVDRVRELVRDAMTGAITLETVALDVDIGVGGNWLEAH